MLPCERTPRQEEQTVVKVLTDEKRRQMILEAFGPESNISKIARQYGINRNTLHEHINRAVRDPEGRWREAQEEANFRRKVYELLR
jgi:transposase-like protein